MRAFWANVSERVVVLWESVVLVVVDGSILECGDAKGFVAGPVEDAVEKGLAWLVDKDFTPNSVSPRFAADVFAAGSPVFVSSAESLFKLVMALARTALKARTLPFFRRQGFFLHPKTYSRLS